MIGAEKAGSFLPAQLLKLIAEGTLEKRFPAVVAFADVSGFTAMSERLASIGKEGAETLTGILNGYFTAMIERIHDGGGFVGKFGGDAMTVFFPADMFTELPSVTERAVATCCDLQAMMEPFHQIKTKAGDFSLGMKIGIGVGNVLFRVLTDSEGTRDYVLAGQPLDLAAEAEHHGKSGEVILNPSAAKTFAERGEVIEGGFLRIDPALISNNGQQSSLPEDHLRNDLAVPFIDPAVYHRILLGLDSVGEIRKVSVVFLSFTGFDYDNDPEVGEKLNGLYGWVQRVTKSFNGSINKLDMGDKGSKILITFGTPTAHENDEQLAVRCGLELVASSDAMARWGGRVKAGIATGVVFAGEVGAPTRQEYTVMGRGVNLSARLMGRAKPGELLIDEVTHSRIERLFECGTPEMVELKGISQPMAVRAVLGLKSPGGDTADSQKPLVGRIDELTKIKSIIAEVASGSEQTLIIKGEAGTGKSRLLEESIALMRKEQFGIGGGEALSYAKQSPYLSLIAALRGLMELPASSDAALQSIERIVSEADSEHAFRTPIIAGLFGIRAVENEITQYFDAKLRQENMFDFLVQYFKYRTEANPAAIVIEDAQWIDRSSLELIAYLLRNLHHHKLLVILVRRPYSRQFVTPHIGEIEKASNATVIEVREFSRSDLRDFVLQELNATEVEDELLDFVFGKSQGNPAFAEQLLQSLFRLGNIALRPDGERIVASSVGDLAAVEVPDSLNSLIMSQLDRLGAESKLTVKLASVIGRRFSRELVVSSYPVEMNEQRIGETLLELSQLDVVRPEVDTDMMNYIFKNLLTRDVAYDSLLFAHRREYHRRIGLCLEQIYNESIEEQCEELARHFYQGEDNGRAVRYLRMAGDKAFGLYANESAEDYFTKALERIAEDDFNERFKLLSVRSKVFSIIGRTEAQKADLDEALRLAEAQQDMRGKVETLDHLAQFYFKANNLDVLEQIINQAQAILATIEYPVARVGILAKMGALKYARNDFKGALQSWEEGAVEAERIEDQVGLSVALTNCGVAHKALGDLEKALENYHKSISIDKTSGNLKSEAVNLGNLAVLSYLRSDYDVALDAYQHAFEIAKGIGSKEIQARNLGGMALLYQMRGERAKALESHQQKLGIEQMMGYQRGQAVTLGNLGAWYSENGDFDLAVDYYEQALEIVRKLNLNSEEPRLMMNIGLVHHYKGENNVALDLLIKAVDISIEVRHKVAEEYARKYLAFVHFELGNMTSAAEQFRLSGEVAATFGSKAGIAGSKVGLGLIEMCDTGKRELLNEGLAEVRKLGDTEIVIKGEILLARLLLKNAETYTQAEPILNDALEIARATGRRRDIVMIESVLQNANFSQQHKPG